MLDDDVAIAFLDVRPLFPGHTLLVPREHVETLADLPVERLGPYFERAQRLAGGDGGQRWVRPDRSWPSTTG